jgi:DNA-binding NarL/FixJ family response regulator
MRILLVDDHFIFREGLASLLDSQPDMTVVGKTDSAEEAVRLAQEDNPDIILMDYVLPDGTGVEATRKILAKMPDCKIVIMTVHEDDAHFFSGISSGAVGYLPKRIKVQDLFEFLRGIQNGEAAVPGSFVSRIVKRFAEMQTNHETTPSPIAKLTPREREVLHEINAGASNRAIAEHLCITERTVKAHVSNILAKLGLESRHQAAHFARRHNM